MRRFVVFDIHGCYDQFKYLMNLWSFDYEKDLLISIGDLCDRGYETNKVLDELLLCKNRILIKGNHDIPFYTWLKTGIELEYWNELWGNGNTKKSYINVPTWIKERHVKLLEEQKLYHLDQSGNLFCHSGIDINLKLEDMSEDTFIWNNTLFNRKYDISVDIKDMRINKVFAGHKYCKDSMGIPPKPIITNFYINGDTGCGKGGLLTMMNIDTLEYKQFSNLLKK